MCDACPMLCIKFGKYLHGGDVTNGSGIIAVAGGGNAVVIEALLRAVRTRNLWHWQPQRWYDCSQSIHCKYLISEKLLFFNKINNPNARVLCTFVFFNENILNFFNFNISILNSFKNILKHIKLMFFKKKD